MRASVVAHPHVAAGAMLALVVFAYLWPVLVGGRILSPIADLYGAAIWRTSMPPHVWTLQNRILLDIPLVQYPWRVFARELIHHGVLPAWNPYVLTGIPFYSNPQTGLFSLFNVPLWILPLTYGLGASAAIKLLVGAFGAYLLVRKLRLGFLPGLLAGVAFAFSALNVVWLAHETLPAVAVMLPWAWWLVERIFERYRPRDALALAAVTAIGLGGGHPGMQVHLLVATAAYALARAAWLHGGMRERAPWRRTRALSLVGGGLAAGVLVMAFMLVPELRSTHDTVGVLARRAHALPGQHIPPAALQTVAFPDRWGRPSAYENVADVADNPVGVANYNERTFYAGAVALLLACVGVLSRGGWRRRAPFLLLGPLGVAVAVHAPVVYWLATHLPVLDVVEAQRLHFMFGLAAPVLAAFGLQAVLDRPAGGRWRLAVPALAVLLGALAAATAGADGADVRHTVRHFLTGADFPSSGVLALTSIGWFLLFTSAVAVALLIARRRPRRRQAIALVMVALAVVDALHFAHGYQPMVPAAQAIPPVTPAIAYLERHRAEGRIVGIGDAFPNDWGMLYRLEDVRGYDTPQPTRRMLALWRLANPQQLEWTGLLLPALTPDSLRVLEVLGARYVVLAPGIQVTHPRDRRLRLVYRGPDASIARLLRVTPRAFVPARVALSANEASGRQALLARGFDPRTMAVVERDQPGSAVLARSTPDARGSVTVVGRGNAGVTLRARLARRSLVVLDEQLIDGWTVHVDGRPAQALHADDVMRGVVVPAGRHRIVWSYEVPGLRLGAVVSLATLAALGAGAMALGVRRRRRERWRR